ncbi:MAG: ABC transporter ATP-binding protein [Candidatus Melainabacteria bacterium]|nr:ABC transporter ATP-binding protein [Candidatus Melainabacteria bacterium]
MTNLQIKNLSKSFGSSKVLDDINLKVSEGEFVVLVGPSGSGKSTILRTIAGLEQPDSGNIEINNIVVNNLPPKDRDIAMVFQNYALYPHLNVYENLAFPLKMKGINKNETKIRVKDTAGLLGIENYLKKKPKELSGGERQRVALGRAIIRKPKLFLMDEPLSNLDAKLRTQMRAELLKLHKTLATTVIYVTHDQIEALTMGSKIVVLNKGRIQQIGEPQYVYNFPANTFVAGFIGSPSMNFFNFRFVNSSSVFLEDKEYKVNFKKEFLEMINKHCLYNKKIILGVRPENLNLLNSFNQDFIAFDAFVNFVEILGSECLLYINIKNTQVKNNYVLRLVENCDIKAGEQIKVSIDLNKTHFFDVNSGNRFNND